MTTRSIFASNFFFLKQTRSHKVSREQSFRLISQVFSILATGKSRHYPKNKCTEVSSEQFYKLRIQKNKIRNPNLWYLVTVFIFANISNQLANNSFFLNIFLQLFFFRSIFSNRWIFIFLRL